MCVCVCNIINMYNNNTCSIPRSYYMHYDLVASRARVYIIIGRPSDTVADWFSLLFEIKPSPRHHSDDDLTSRRHRIHFHRPFPVLPSTRVPIPRYMDCVCLKSHDIQRYNKFAGRCKVIHRHILWSYVEIFFYPLKSHAS